MALARDCVVGDRDPGRLAGHHPAPAPDLTLHGRLRGPDWIYSYLLSFYKDPSRPTGVNNAVFELVAMPNVLEPLQGVQEMVCAESDRPIGDAELDRPGIAPVDEEGERRQTQAWNEMCDKLEALDRKRSN